MNISGKKRGYDQQSRGVSGKHAPARRVGMFGGNNADCMRDAFALIPLPEKRRSVVRSPRNNTLSPYHQT
jgi:hypothetical protein